jgi:hypothetical protein
MARCFQCQIEGVPGRDVAGAATAGAVAGEGIAEVLFVGHQLGTPGIQGTLHQDQGRGVQTQGDGVVNEEVTRADLQEQGVVACIDGIHPPRKIGGTRCAGQTSRIGQQHIHAIHGFATGGLNELGEDRLDQDLLLGGTEGHHHVVVDVETQGVEAEEQGDPAEVADDGFLVLQHPGKNVVLVGFRVVVTDEEDRTVGEGTAHQEDGDVLVVRVEGCLGGVVLGDERIGRQRVHVLRHQAGRDSQRGQGQAQLEVQGVVDGVVKALVASA